jgi:hypothetical protein
MRLLTLRVSVGLGFDVITLVLCCGWFFLSSSLSITTIHPSSIMPSLSRCLVLALVALMLCSFVAAWGEEFDHTEEEEPDGI